MKKITTSIFLGLLALVAQAQSLPTDADIAEQRKRVMKAMAETKQVGTPVQAEPTARADTSLKALDNFLTPVNTAAKPVDFTSLSRTGALPQGKPEVEKTGSDLLIFASLSMPETMLINYAAQAKRFGAVIMLRGFVDDKTSKTREALARLNQAGAEFEVSPEPFKHFKVTKVPTFVLASANATSVIENGCAKPDTYITISGDITVADALDKFSLLSKSVLAKDAKARLVNDRQTAKKG